MRVALSFFALVACDPVRSVQGRVSSQAQAADGAGLAGADVALVCPERRELLAKTDRDGGFSHVQIGYWPGQCAIEASTFDGSHRRAVRTISELCRASGGDADCLRIVNADFTLQRVSEGRRKARLVFRPSDPRLSLVHHSGEREAVLCTGACETEVFAGEQWLSVRLDRTSRELWQDQTLLSGEHTLDATFVEDTDPRWPSLLGTAFVAAGAGLLLYAGWKEETVPAVAGVSSVAVGLTLSLIWMPDMHSAEVSFTPATPRAVR